MVSELGCYLKSGCYNQPSPRLQGEGLGLSDIDLSGRWPISGESGTLQEPRESAAPEAAIFPGGL